MTNKTKNTDGESVTIEIPGNPTEEQVEVIRNLAEAVVRHNMEPGLVQAHLDDDLDGFVPSITDRIQDTEYFRRMGAIGLRSILPDSYSLGILKEVPSGFNWGDYLEWKKNQNFDELPRASFSREDLYRLAEQGKIWIKKNPDPPDPERPFNGFNLPGSFIITSEGDFHFLKIDEQNKCVFIIE